MNENAHNSAIKSILVHPSKPYFITGSTDGDIKIWNSKTFQLVDTIVNIHPKNTLIKPLQDAVVYIYIYIINLYYS